MRGLVAAVAVAALALGAGPASAYVYWGTTDTPFGDNGNGFLGRANLDGTGLTEPFAGTPSPARPRGVAVSATHIYWTDGATLTIARSKLDGTGVEPGFISGVEAAWDVAVDDTYIYWTDKFHNAIGRAKLDGTDVDKTFITGASSPQGLAIDAGHLYWANTGSGAIGRATLDGSVVNNAFIAGVGVDRDVAVNGSHVFWTRENGASGAIGRANLDGTAPNPSYITGTGPVSDLAVDSNYIYFDGDTDVVDNQFRQDVGRVALNGSNLNKSFITGPGLVSGFTLAGGFIYWADAPEDRIGRAGIGGTNVKLGLVDGRAIEATDLATDGVYLYWVSENRSWIGRSKLDGTSIEPSFIYAGNPAKVATWLPKDIAVGGGHVYWTYVEPTERSGNVGRADLDGGNINPTFVKLNAQFLDSVAVDDSYVYWTQGDNGYSIGRANLNGGDVQPSFVTGVPAIFDLVTNGTHLFWATYKGSIGRTNIDGTGSDPTFIAPDHLSEGQKSIAVDATRIYWASPLGWGTSSADSHARIGRANIDGTGVNEEFLNEDVHPLALVVDAFGPAAPDTLTVSVSGSGGTVTGPGLSCPDDCSEAYPSGINATLTPTQAPGWIFDHWTGDCQGTGACRVTTHGDRRVGAVFKFVDTDGDGVADSADNCPTVPNGEQYDLDLDDQGDFCDPDDDDDGVDDQTEHAILTYSFDVDSDDDGLGDGAEHLSTKTHPAPIDPLYGNGFDSDGDGLSDGLELGVTTGIDPVPPELLGTDAARFVPDLDPATKTNPLKKDTDGDRLADGTEDRNRNGRREPTETNPLKKDTDGDGLADGIEDRNRNGRRDPGETSPLKKDTDGDGLNDRVDRHPLGSGVPATGPETVNAVPVSGVVRVRQPLEHRFHRLHETRQIDVGSVVDASDGHVRVEYPRLVAGARKAARIGGGRFKLEQGRDPTHTYLVMIGGEVRHCGGAKLRARKLSVSGSGTWATIGRYVHAMASGRRAAWVVYDRCDGSTVVARRGDVEARDRVARRTITVTEGHRYLARRPVRAAVASR
jgi:hypothetical protein